MTIEITHEEWIKAAIKRYGKTPRGWRFVCPICKFVQSGQDFLDAGLTPEKAATVLAFSCVGRFRTDSRRAFEETGVGPCDYTTGGLINVSPIVVTMEDERQVYAFDFADEPLDLQATEAAGARTR